MKVCFLSEQSQAFNRGCDTHCQSPFCVSLTRPTSWSRATLQRSDDALVIAASSASQPHGAPSPLVVCRRKIRPEIHHQRSQDGNWPATWLDRNTRVVGCVVAAIPASRTFLHFPIICFQKRGNSESLLRSAVRHDASV